MLNNARSKEVGAKSDDPCGEIIESSLHTWIAQSWQWDTFLPFGSLVTIQNNHTTTFGIVYQIQTGSMDPGRYPFAYQKTEAELLSEQPQIFEFLKTTLSCIPVGYQEIGSPITYLAPPIPPKIHSFIQPATIEQSRQFFSQEQFLHLLYGSSSVVAQADELLLAIIMRLLPLHILRKKEIIRLMHTYSLLTSNDYRRMKLFLARLQRVMTDIDY